MKLYTYPLTHNALKIEMLLNALGLDPHLSQWQQGLERNDWWQQTTRQTEQFIKNIHAYA